MTQGRRAFLKTVGLAGGIPALLRAGSSERRLTPDFVHRELVQGNLHFASGHPRHPHATLAWVRRTGKNGQHPHAVVLCCSDSRVVPEILFDQGMGDIFTVRVAGNVANEDELASIEYATEHFGVPLCVVLGHSSCGAVKAVVDSEHLPSEIDHLVLHIKEAHAKARAEHPSATHDQLLEMTVRANVIRNIQLLTETPSAIRDAASAGRLRIEGGVYNLVTGRVSWISPGELTHR